jgi:predicted AAA+ superfamily ATPase
MKTLPRLVSTALSERMRVMPAVVVTGARQTGKCTLAEQLRQSVAKWRPHPPSMPARLSRQLGGRNFYLEY